MIDMKCGQSFFTFTNNKHSSSLLRSGISMLTCYHERELYNRFYSLCKQIYMTAALTYGTDYLHSEMTR